MKDRAAPGNPPDQAHSIDPACVTIDAFNRLVASQGYRGRTPSVEPQYGKTGVAVLYKEVLVNGHVFLAGSYPVWYEPRLQRLHVNFSSRAARLVRPCYRRVHWRFPQCLRVGFGEPRDLDHRGDELVNRLF